MAEKDEDDLLFQEINEELKQDQYLKLWRAYGQYAVGAAVAVVIGVAGYQGWNAYDLSTRTADTARFQSALALAASDKADAALNAFAAIARDGSGGIAMLARFQEARLLAAKGDTAGAAGVYRTLAGDTSIDPIYRDVALIQGALLEVNAVGTDLGDLDGRLAPLAAATSPWRHMAREIQAIIAHRRGDRDAARTLYAELAASREAPQGVRQRAQEMLSILAQ